VSTRRKFVALLGGAATAWPLAAGAQQLERVRRIGVLMDLATDDPLSRARINAFLQALEKLGWTIGRNVRIDYRWTAGDAERIRAYAGELVALSPDVIMTVGASHAGPLQRATRTVPIVFTAVSDPVGGGFVASLARPGGNVTGFTPYEYSMSGKWLELLRQIAPRVMRAAVVRDATSPSGVGQWGAIQAIAPSFGVEVSPIDVHDAPEIERGILALPQELNVGLIVLPTALTLVHRELIVELAARRRLPTIYADRLFVTDGGLIAYGPDFLDQFRRAAGYVDRILKGEKPADLPVQAPTKYELVINLKTAKTLGLEVPPSLLARAAEVIE
jgi:putative ABC transport system substrate-binding protein